MKSKEEILQENSDLAKDLLWVDKTKDADFFQGLASTVFKSMEEYAQQVAIDFGQWATHNDWVYLPSKDYWLNEEQEELFQPMTNEQLFELYKQSKL